MERVEGKNDRYKLLKKFARNAGALTLVGVMSACAPSGNNNKVTPRQSHSIRTNDHLPPREHQAINGYPQEQAHRDEKEATRLLKELESQYGELGRYGNVAVQLIHPTSPAIIDQGNQEFFFDVTCSLVDNNTGNINPESQIPVPAKFADNFYDFLDDYYANSGFYESDLDAPYYAVYRSFPQHFATLYDQCLDAKSSEARAQLYRAYFPTKL